MPEGRADLATLRGNPSSNWAARGDHYSDQIKGASSAKNLRNRERAAFLSQRLSASRSPGADHRRSVVDAAHIAVVGISAQAIAISDTGRRDKSLHGGKGDRIRRKARHAMRLNGMLVKRIRALSRE